MSKRPNNKSKDQRNRQKKVAKKDNTLCASMKEPYIEKVPAEEQWGTIPKNGIIVESEQQKNEEPRPMIIKRFIAGFHKIVSKLLDGLDEGVLTHFLWKGKDKRSPVVDLISKWLYIFIPFLVVTLFAFLVISAESAASADPKYYSFVNDYTNSFTLFFLLVFSYFMNGLFAGKFSQVLSDCFKPVPPLKNGRVRIARGILTIASAIVGLCSIDYIEKAQQIGADKYWLNNISTRKYYFYCVLIYFTFFAITRLCLLNLVNAICIFLATSEKRKNWPSYSEKKQIYNCGARLMNCFATSISWGVGVLIAVGIMLYSDFLASKDFDVPFTLYENKTKIIAAMVILSAIYFGLIILSIMNVKRFLKENVQIANLNENYQNLSNPVGIRGAFSWSFVLATLLPGLAALLQILSPLSDFLQ